MKAETALSEGLFNKKQQEFGQYVI